MSQRAVRGSGSAGPATVKAVEKEAAALALRRAGASFEAIAHQVGYGSRSSAYKAVQRSLRRTVEQPAAELRQLEAERLDALQMAVWRDAMRGDKDAVASVLRVMERRAKLLGLDQPAEVRLQLEVAQVDFMEAALRRVLDGVQSALTDAGLEQQIRHLWPVIEGEVVPRELSALASKATG